MKHATGIIATICAVLFFGWALTVNVTMTGREKRFEAIEHRLDVLERPCQHVGVLAPDGVTVAVCLK